MSVPTYVPPHDPGRGGASRWLTIIVYPKDENQRPVGFAPWPESPATPTKSKRKKRRK